MGKDKRGVYRWGCRNCEDCEEFQTSSLSLRCEYCDCAPTHHNKGQSPSQQATACRSSQPEEYHLNSPHQSHSPADRQSSGYDSPDPNCFLHPRKPPAHSISWPPRHELYKPRNYSEQPREAYYGHQQDRRYIYEGREPLIYHLGDFETDHVPLTQKSGYESCYGEMLPQDDDYQHGKTILPMRSHGQVTSNDQFNFPTFKSADPPYHHQAETDSTFQPHIEALNKSETGQAKIDGFAAMVQERFRKLEEEHSNLKNEWENLHPLFMAEMDRKPDIKSPISTNQAVACVKPCISADSIELAYTELSRSLQKSVTFLDEVTKDDLSDSRKSLRTVTEISMPGPNSERGIQNSRVKSDSQTGSRGPGNTAVLALSVSSTTSAVKQDSVTKTKQPIFFKLDQNHPMFHPRIHGKTIYVEKDGMTAHSDNNLCSGICFSRYPCKIGQKIHLMITETRKFTGSLRIGFTFNDPESVDQESLPSHSYPDLAQKPGFWIKPLHDRFAQQGYVVTYMVDSSGDVFYSINGKDKGLFFSGVDVSGRIWAAVDVYGSTVAVRFVDEEAACDKANKTIHEGDVVRLEVDSVETLKWLQEGHGGLGDLGECINQDGVAIRLDDEEDVIVRFNSYKKLWCVNPEALKKVGTAAPDSSMIMEGDLVTDISMSSCYTGRVIKISVSGDICVRNAAGNAEKLTAECLRKVQMAPGEACEKGLHIWKRGVAKVCTECGQCTDKGASCNLKSSPLRSPGSPCGCGNKEEGCADCGLCRTCAGETPEESDIEEDVDLAKLLHALSVGDEQEETARVMTKGYTVPADSGSRSFHMSKKESRLPGHHESRAWIQTGELVKVLKDEGAVKKLQEGHGGYQHDMQASLGKTGFVVEVKKDQVKVEINFMSWWFNPEALSPVLQAYHDKHLYLTTSPVGSGGVASPCQFKEGDQVKVDLDVYTFKRNQACHGGYVNRMAELVENVGVVHHIDIDGDAIVYYPNGTRWCINPLSLRKLSPEERHVMDVSGVMEVGDWVKVESDKKKMKHVQKRTVSWDEGYYDAAGKVGQVHTIYPFNDIIFVDIEHKGYPLDLSLVTNATTQDIHEAFGSGCVTNPGVARGDLVKISVSLEQLKRMQDGHGGFVDHMEEVIGTIGSVSHIDRDGDVYVRFGEKSFWYNPDALFRMSSVEDSFYVGDIVLIESDQTRFKRLQTDKHGGYNSRMLSTCGKTGRLHSLISHKRIRVKVQGKVWVFNPDLLTRMGNPGLGTGDWRSATICAPHKHDWSTGRCLVCVKCGECTHYGRLCPHRGKLQRYPGSLCGCGNGDAGCDDCGYCKRCAGDLHLKDREDDRDDVLQKLLLCSDIDGLYKGVLSRALFTSYREWQAKKSWKSQHSSMRELQRQALKMMIAADKSETTGHGQDERPAPPREKMVPVLKKMSQAVELMRKSKSLDSLNAVKNTLENDCIASFLTYRAIADRQLMGDTLANIDGAQVFMEYLQLLSCNDEVTTYSLECIEVLQKLLIECTESSFEFCRAVGRCGLLQMFVQDLVALHKEAQNGLENSRPMIQSVLIILANCARTPDNQEVFTRCGAAEALKPYLRNRDAYIRVLTLSCLAFIVENQNMHLIRLNVDGAQLIVSLLKEALDNPNHDTMSIAGGYRYPAFELVTMLGALVRNDENKQVFITNGVVDLLLKLIESGNDREKEATILCIQKLAYSDHIRALIRKDTRAEEVLRATKQNRDLSAVIRDVATAALQILRDGPPSVVEDPSGGSGRISTISYSDLTVKEAVGKGAFGQVCRGYHKKWMVDVAVKKLNSSSREQLIRRSKALEQEANFMYRTKNANRFIVGLYGVCIEDTFTAMIMEFMANGSVADLMSRVKHVPWALRWRILHETILGMNFLHSLDPQIIHRDLKSPNVLLDEDFHAKISDFGLAEYKPLASIGDEKGNLCGTITHIAPEHFKNPYMKAGVKFDVYSFGIFIWEVLTGKRPYQEIGIGGIIRERVMDGRRPDKKHIPTDGPNELSLFIHLMEKCWDEEPKNRPAFRELGKQVQVVTLKTNAQVAQAIQAVLKEQGEVNSTHQSQRLYHGRLASIMRPVVLSLETAIKEDSYMYHLPSRDYPVVKLHSSHQDRVSGSYLHDGSSGYVL